MIQGPTIRREVAHKRLYGDLLAQFQLSSRWHRYIAATEVVGNQLVNRLIAAAFVDFKRLLACHSETNQHWLQPPPPAMVGHRRSNNTIIVSTTFCGYRPFVVHQTAHFFDKRQ